MSSTSTMSRKETERSKLIQEKCQTLLTQMLRDEDNKYCVDCDAKGPRWASWNLGVFLCIRCAGIHRNLGVHISRVKSVNLDTWTPEQVISLQQMGNSRARAVYEAQLPDGFRRPQTDTALESFVRAKYEHKKYLAREWVSPSPPKVDWAKEIDEELERQKRKKKAAQANSTLGVGVMSGSSGSGADRKPTSAKSNAPLPAPLPKPGQSPKANISISSAGSDLNQSNDLLSLSSPTKPIKGAGGSIGGATSGYQDLHSDTFSSFVSATPFNNPGSGSKMEANANVNSVQNALAKEEADFFNQGSLVSAASSGREKDNMGKLTKDSILALYGTASSSAHNPHHPQMNFGQPQQAMYSGAGAFSGLAPGYLGSGAAPHPQQPQFMTPPNSTSMYNAPVMTAPAAFTAPGMGMGMHLGANGAGSAAPASGNATFGAQFRVQNMNSTNLVSGYVTPSSSTSSVDLMGSGGGRSGVGPFLGTGQLGTPSNLNFMPTNQSLMSGMTMGAAQPQMSVGIGMGIGMSMPITSGMPSMSGIPAATGAGASIATTGNLNQQFGNLNIGNVWQ